MISLEMFMAMITDPNRRKLYQFVDARDREEASLFDINPERKYDDMTIVNLSVTRISEWADHIAVVLNSDRPTICFCNDGTKSTILGDYLSKLKVVI